MSTKPVMFQKVWDNIHEAYYRLEKQQVSGTHLPRQNYSDACKVLSGMSILDLITEINVELKTSEDDLVVIFSKVNGDD